MSYIPNVHAIRGLAPTASQFNQLANNLEYVHTAQVPKTALLTLSGNQALTITAVTSLLIASLTFNTLSFDTNSMWTGSALNIPSTANYARIVFNLALSLAANKEFQFSSAISENQSVLTTGVRQIWRTFEIGNNATGDAISRNVNLDTGWVNVSQLGVLDVSTVSIYGLESSTLTVLSGNSTWLSLEVI